MFFAHGHKFLLIACVFLVPLFLIDEALYDHRALLQSQDLYTPLDGTLYLFVFFVWIVYYIVLYRFIDYADQNKRIGLFSWLAGIRRYFLPCLRAQVMYGLKILAWSLMFLIPGFFAACIYSFAGLAILCDEKQGKEAFLASRQIVASSLNQYFDMVVLALMLQTSLFVPFFLLLNLCAHFLNAQLYHLRFLLFEFFFYLLVFIHVIIFQIFYYYLYQELKNTK